MPDTREYETMCDYPWSYQVLALCPVLPSSFGTEFVCLRHELNHDSDGDRVFGEYDTKKEAEEAIGKFGVFGSQYVILQTYRKRFAGVG